MATVRFTGCGTCISRGTFFFPVPSRRSLTEATLPSSFSEMTKPIFSVEKPKGGTFGSRS